MSTKKQIGRIPVSKGEYVAGQTYNRLNQVTMYGSTYQSRIDGNTSAPAIMDDEGNVQHTNTDQWLVIADGREAYNAGEKLSCFSLKDSEEHLALETDAEGKILSSTNADGSHYAYKMKSETIDAKQDKEDGKGLIDEGVAESMSVVDDEEGRLQMTKDADGKIISFRDSEGTLHEHKIAPSHISLSDEAAKEVNEAFKSAGIKMENPSDFSNDLYVELPIPRIAAQVKIYAPKLPTTKTEDIEAEIEYNDKDGNYFRKPVILNAQGSSSMGYFVKNLAIDLDDGSEIKFGDFPTQDSFHLKKYYIDIFRGQCVVGYWLMEQVYKTHPIGEQYPYENQIQNDSTQTGLGSVKKDFFTGAKCHPDGFPIIITWVNTNTNEEKEMGLYAWNLKKSKEIYYADKKKAENIILDGLINYSTLFGGTVDWSAFEIRNPKSLKDIDENKYDGDNPKELSDTDTLSKKVKGYITRLSGLQAAMDKSMTKESYESFIIVPSMIDYYLLAQMTFHTDGFAKNWIWCTWDGLHWAPTAYDMDSIFGSFWRGTEIYENCDFIIADTLYGLTTLYDKEIKSRYKELRDSKVFDADNIYSLLKKWIDMCGYDNIQKEIELYPETPSYRESYVNENWQHVSGQYSSKPAYSPDTTYNTGDEVMYAENIFKARNEVTGIPPLDKLYENDPKGMGCYNSPKRVYNWLVHRLEILDSKYEYTK